MGTEEVLVPKKFRKHTFPGYDEMYKKNGPVPPNGIINHFTVFTTI